MIEEKYLSIPYKKQGRGWDGCDCYGLARLVIKEESGVDLPSFEEKTAPDEEVYTMFKPLVNPEDLSIVFLQGGPFHEAHTGVYSNGFILHMTEHGACSVPYKRISRFIKGIYAPMKTRKK